MIELEKITDRNICYYSDFEKADLSKYQSRIYSHKKSDTLSWYYIKFNSGYIGSVWLEKYGLDNFAVLGIFIADNKCRNRGIGSCAIKSVLADMEILNINEVRLRVREENIRAIKCYQKSGFAETGRYTKDNGINVIEMVYKR